jgi:hypothetical protein
VAGEMVGSLGGVGGFWFDDKTVEEGHGRSFRQKKGGRSWRWLWGACGVRPPRRPPWDYIPRPGSGFPGRCAGLTRSVPARRPETLPG